MTEVKAGDLVRIHYTGTLQDGSVFDSSDGRDPLEFTVGSGQIIPGLDQALPGMTAGDKKVVEVLAEHAYGPVQADAQQDVPRSQFPADMDLQIGLRLQMQMPDGNALPVVVVALAEDSVTLDGNHPLAGKDLTFAIELMSIG